MNTRFPVVLASMAVLSLAACGSPSAEVSPTVASAPTDTLVPPSPTAFPASPTPNVELSRRGYHAAAYDVESDRIVVFGGGSNSHHWLSDTWTYDITANMWTEVSPSDSPGLTEAPMDYDSAVDRMILFAGSRMLSANLIDRPGMPFGIDKASQTWAYDYQTNTWSDLHAVEGPSGLLGARMVYDGQSDRMILFGGLELPLQVGTFVLHNETWAYDFKTNTWTDMKPQRNPPGRNYFMMAYDPVSDRVLVWGASLNVDDNDIWAYDFETNTWTAQPVTQPSNRDYGAMTYVPTLQRVLLFGGVTLAGENPLDEMWTYDPASQTWEQITLGSGPSARGWHTLTYSTKADRVVVIGGGKDRDSYTNEVWLLDPASYTWAQVDSK